MGAGQAGRRRRGGADGADGARPVHLAVLQKVRVRHLRRGVFIGAPRRDPRHRRRQADARQGVRHVGRVVRCQDGAHHQGVRRPRQEGRICAQHARVHEGQQGGQGRRQDGRGWHSRGRLPREGRGLDKGRCGAGAGAGGKAGGGKDKERGAKGGGSGGTTRAPHPASTSTASWRRPERGWCACAYPRRGPAPTSSGCTSGTRASRSAPTSTRGRRRAKTSSTTSCT